MIHAVLKEVAMGLKQPETLILSNADFDAAVVRLRLNVSEIAKATSIPRTYLSEFRNGDRKLRPENLAKLRDYFESKGIEFEDEPAADLEQESGQPGSPHPSLMVGTVCYFPVRGDLTPDQVRAAVIEIDRNDARIAEILAIKAIPVNDVFGDPKGYSEETDNSIRELFALFGANWTLFRYLTGIKNPLAAPVEKDTVNRVLLDTVRESVERAGVAMQYESEIEEAKA
jgi:transcriptional regulator with XRE-family HTH domain